MLLRRLLCQPGLARRCILSVHDGLALRAVWATGAPFALLASRTWPNLVRVHDALGSRMRLILVEPVDSSPAAPVAAGCVARLGLELPTLHLAFESAPQLALKHDVIRVGIVTNKAFDAVRANRLSNLDRDTARLF